ncbi:branched-chain amino acid ABC transporter permease [Thermaerobacter marianensis]|uniref:branched-chain amino acid ABC transporter permease n=1 Tax=Thermaerobacter marianensis TaxID=73919 RepID=UPI0005AA6EB5|nr:branched-chain amino acid ABC transporter permease [Thermaerobacter marianensis]
MVILKEDLTAKRSRVQLGVLAALAAFLLLAPAIIGEYGLGLLTEMLVFGVFAMSLDLLIGHAGLVSLGHAAFFGAGGYAAGLLARHLGLTSWPGLVAGILAGVLLAALFAPVVLRASGAYFLMLTLALGQLLYGMVWLWRPVTGGDDGLPGLPRPELPLLGGILWDNVAFYYFTLVCTGVAALSMAWLVTSPFGLTLRGIRDNELRLESLGYHTWLYKYAIYVIAAGYAGLAGTLYAYYAGYVSPHNLSWALSGEAMVMVILGGAGTLWGPALGAALVLVLKYVVSSFTDRWLAILGLTFVLTVLFAPHGLAGLVRKLRWPAGRAASLDRVWAGSQAVPAFLRRRSD